MTFDNSIILKQLKIRCGNSSIKLPGKIQMQFDGKNCCLTVSSLGVLENMQNDAGAFEGWAIVLYRWLNPEAVIIGWEKPDESNGHYQRFLFRVTEFCKEYCWCKIAENCKEMTADLRISENGGIYIVNASDKVRNQSKPNERSKEACLEMNICNNPSQLSSLTDAVFINRQLPVGLFENEVTDENIIFTGKKSAVDLWGMDTENNLLIFELKADGNRKIGIISELFFYAIFMLKVKNGLFKSPSFPDFKTIRTFFLASKVHPLIDDKVIEILNNNTSVISYSIISNNDFDLVTECK